MTREWDSMAGAGDDGLHRCEGEVNQETPEVSGGPKDLYSDENQWQTGWVDYCPVCGTSPPQMLEASTDQ